MRDKKKFLKCAKCGIVDKTDRSDGYIGTSEIMKCKDCCTEQSNGYATLCRHCCPTEHRTKTT